MAKVTDDFVIARFHRIFAKLPGAEQRGIIRGLQTIHDAMQHVAQPEPETEAEKVTPQQDLIGDGDEDSTDG